MQLFQNYNRRWIYGVKKMRTVRMGTHRRRRATAPPKNTNRAPPSVPSMPNSKGSRGIASSAAPLHSRKYRQDFRVLFPPRSRTLFRVHHRNQGLNTTTNGHRLTLLSPLRSPGDRPLSLETNERHGCRLLLLDTSATGLASPSGKTRAVGRRSKRSPVALACLATYNKVFRTSTSYTTTARHDTKRR